MLMRYYCGLGVGHSYAQPASMSSDQLSEMEEFLPESYDIAAVASRDQALLPNQEEDSASEENDDEESCSDHSSDFIDASGGSGDDDTDNDIEDEELHELESMYGD